MLWLKALHVVFVVTWFAGLFYLPRLFIYHVRATDALGIARFRVMERRLFVIMSIGAVLAVGFGIAMIIAAPAYLSLPWLRVKVVLVALLTVKLVAAIFPKLTAVAFVKFVPVIVTDVPPAVGPDVGLMLVTVGAET